MLDRTTHDSLLDEAARERVSPSARALARRSQARASALSLCGAALSLPGIKARPSKSSSWVQSLDHSSDGRVDRARLREKDSSARHYSSRSTPATLYSSPTTLLTTLAAWSVRISSGAGAPALYRPTRTTAPMQKTRTARSLRQVEKRSK